MVNPKSDAMVAKQVAKTLLKLEAVKINVENQFTWTSGIKSPIYCNNRIVNSDIDARKQMVDSFVEIIKENFPDVQIIAGIATGGMPLGVLIADKMRLPFIYVRSEKKGHGLMKQVEGSFKSGDKIVLIEDHISTGGSSLKAIDGIREEKLELLGLVSLMTYGFNKAQELFDSNNVKNISLCDLNQILDVAWEENMISKEQKEIVLDFKKSQD